VHVEAGSHATAAQVGAFLDRLPTGTRVLLVRRGHGVLTVQGSCSDLHALSLDCPAASTPLDQAPADPRVRELIRWNSRNGRVQIERGGDAADAVTRKTGEETELVLVSSGGDLPVPALKRLSYDVFPLGAAVAEPGATWLAGSAPQRDHARWSVLFGGLGFAVLTLAVGLVGVAEFLRQERAVAPSPARTGGQRTIRSSAAWSVLLPLGLAGVVGAAVGALIAGPVVHAGGPSSGSLLIGGTAVAVGWGLVMWAWAASLAVRQADERRPGGDGVVPVWPPRTVTHVE
jgi:hypothetical protein